MRCSTICLTGGPVFDGEKMISRGSVLFSEDGICEVSEGEISSSGALSMDVEGQLIMPGMVDLHSDALEQSIEVRAGVYFDFEFAFRSLDRRIAACGITTYSHALSFADNDVGVRSPHEVERIVRMVKSIDRASDTMVNHLIHARYEVGSQKGLEVLERLMDEGLIDMVSVMDHTPGQGQFATLGAYVDYYAGGGEDPETVLDVARQKAQVRDAGWGQVGDFSRKVRGAGLPFLSHDDDSAEKVSLVKVLGVGASEFPLSMEAAEEARKEGLRIFMGAPNLVRGRSSGGHLSAAETVSRRLCDGLLSDYYPECMIQAPFMAISRRNKSQEYALSLVTSGPGRFIRLGLGTLKAGLPADMIVVDPSGPWARVTQSWVGGRMVQFAGSRSEKNARSSASVSSCQKGGPEHDSAA